MKLFKRKTKASVSKDQEATQPVNDEGMENRDFFDTEENSGREETSGPAVSSASEDEVDETPKPKKTGFWGKFKKDHKEATGIGHAASPREPADASSHGSVEPIVDPSEEARDAEIALESQGEAVTSDASTKSRGSTEGEKKGFWSRFTRKGSSKDEADVEEPLSEASEDHVTEEPASEKSHARELDIDEPDEDSQAPVATEETEEPEHDKRGFFKRLRTRLSSTRKAFVNRVDELLLGKKEIDEELLEELEEVLITSDIGVHTSVRLIEAVREKVERKVLNSPAELRQALQAEILGFLQVDSPPFQPVHEKPHVIMVVGVNGVGKTTTIGKLAARYRNDGQEVLLVAADTFRAAAVEQLQIWSDRIGCNIIKHAGKSDPSAVAFDGIQAAKSRNADVVIIDTAGRLHTKTNLMEELKKIRRTVTGQLNSAPHETLLVLDATTGQNAISQAELFNEALELTGIALTKLDGTAKGGIVVGICESLGVPLKYIGIGEKAEDLQPFDADEFIQALFQSS